MELTVVHNAAGQYSVWPAGRSMPSGWTSTSVSGSWEICSAAIDQRWCDPVAPAGLSGAGQNVDLVRCFAEVAASQPDATAVSDGSSSLTYAELGRRSAVLAQELRGRGVQAEDRVAIYLRRSVDTFVAMLGILKAGGAYVAIDQRLPAARRDLMVSVGQAKIVLVDPDWIGEPVIEGVAVLPWGSTPATDSALDDDAAASLQDSAACVLFTSGSSGTPKGVVLTHGNLVGFARNSSLPSLSRTDRVGQVSSLSFDAFHFEAWCSLTQGAEVVVLPSIVELLGMDIQREIRRRQITAMLVPTMAVNQVLRVDSEAFASLRILHTGGDVLLPDACRELLASSFTGQFFNLYGPTETTTACTAYPAASIEADCVNVPIGRPLDGVGIRVLDQELNEVEDGVVGELFVAGVGVGRGYVGAPSLTAQKFRPDPYGPPGTRMYATGDLARRGHDGLLEFMGRADHQVKIRGYRVEPGEVERTLCRHADVRDAAVVACGDGEDRQLVSLLVAHDDDLKLASLREWVVKELPDYMVPAAFIVVPEVPANAHGKRDVEAIGVLVEGFRRRRDAHVPAATDDERFLARLWEEMLSVEQVGRTDDFFDLGGHSLLAFRMQRRIKRDLKVNLDFSQILDNSSLMDLAALIAMTRRTGEVPA